MSDTDEHPNRVKAPEEIQVLADKVAALHEAFDFTSSPDAAALQLTGLTDQQLRQIAAIYEAGVAQQAGTMDGTPPTFTQGIVIGTMISYAAIQLREEDARRRLQIVRENCTDTWVVGETLKIEEALA